MSRSGDEHFHRFSERRTSFGPSDPALIWPSQKVAAEWQSLPPELPSDIGNFVIDLDELPLMAIAVDDSMLAKGIMAAYIARLEPED